MYIHICTYVDIYVIILTLVEAFLAGAGVVYVGGSTGCFGACYK